MHAVSGSPAQAVLHGALEIMPEKPALVVSGINYGENVGLGVTISGTVGAAMEAASWASRLWRFRWKPHREFHFSYSKDIDFSAAAHFAAFFGRLLLEKKLPEDVRLLKVDVPSDATVQTPWQVTRVSAPAHTIEPQLSQPGILGRLRAAVVCRGSRSLKAKTRIAMSIVLRKKRMVSVTPISLDLTSRVELTDLEKQLRG